MHTLDRQGTRIIVVDDNPENLGVVAEHLKHAGYKVSVAPNGTFALEQVPRIMPALILLDVKMPNMDGFEVCRRLKQNPDTSGIPIIFLTALTDIGSITQGFEAGGTDYLAKPVNQLELLARVAAHVENYLYKHQLEVKVRRRTADLESSNRLLGESDSVLRATLESTHDGVLVVDQNGRVSHYNARFVDIWSFSPSMLDGADDKRLLDHMLPQLVEPERFCIKMTDIHHGAQMSDGTFHFKDGRIVEGYSKPLIWNGGVGGRVCFFRDITERNRLETRLRQAYKMEAIGTLAGGIAHDFNNILAAILGYTEIARESIDQGSPLFDYLSHVLHAGERAKDLVNQILAFSRESEEALKPVRIALPIKEALQLLRASLPATIDIQHQIRSNAAAMADPTRIHQLIMNLCTNAAHAMRQDGGTLTVTLEDATVSADRPGGTNGLAPGAYVKLIVADTGHGIPEHIVERIFDPFFTTKEKGEGTGMGLAVVHGVVKAHGGSVGVASRPGEGTVFEVWLPAIQENASEAQTVDRLAPGGTETVLLVDDEGMIVDIGQKVLESLGYRVIARTSPVEALEAFKKAPDSIDMVIADMIMPKMTGLRLAEEIVRLRPQMPILLCTGFGTSVDEKKADKLGVAGIIYKPILKQDMADAVRRVLDRRAVSAGERQPPPVDV